MFQTALAKRPAAGNALVWMRSLLALALALLGGCSSGQTGSPDCAPSPACVCDPMYGAGTQLRVRVETYRDGQLRAVIDEVFSSTFGTNGLSIGDHIGGQVNIARPCAPEAPLEAAEGSELFVLFTPGGDGDHTHCSAFQDCASSRCAELVEPALTECWNGCDEETRSSCETARRSALLDGVYAWAIPWSDPLSFGADHELPRSELSVLSSPEQCLQRFPADPAPPCHDTQTVGCAVAPRSRGIAWSGALWLASAVAWGARRRSR